MTRHYTRRETARSTKAYRPPSMLDAPPAPPGQVYRWMRISTLNVDDVKNITQKRRDGWETVPASDHPEYASHTEGRFSGAIGSGDLVLVRNSVENVEARDAYYARMRENQQAAVDQDFLKNARPHRSMPILSERSSEVTRGRRRETSFDE